MPRIVENMSDAFLEIKVLKAHFPVDRGIVFRKSIGTVKAVDGVTLTLAQGETLGIVGESGCGKSTLGRAVLQLIPPTAGQVTWLGQNLPGLPPPPPGRAAGPSPRPPDHLPGPAGQPRPAHACGREHRRALAHARARRAARR